MNIHGKPERKPFSLRPPDVPMDRIQGYYERATGMSQAERQAFVEQRNIKFPENYVVRYDSGQASAVQMPTERRDACVRNMKALIHALYGIPEEAVSTQWTAPQQLSRTYGMMARRGLTLGRGKTLFSSDSNHNAPIGIDYMVRLLWWREHIELSDATVSMARGVDQAEVVLVERETRWVDENDQLHRENGPAIIDPSGTNQPRYYWHGTQVDEGLYKKPQEANLHHILKEPGFSIIGGFAGLAKHREFECISTKGSCELYEGGGSKTYYYESHLRSVQNNPNIHHQKFTGRKWHGKPKRFLLDHSPGGMSGWVSKGVKTIPGAQRSLLRLKLTQGRAAR